MRKYFSRRLFWVVCLLSAIMLGGAAAVQSADLAPAADGHYDYYSYVNCARAGCVFCPGVDDCCMGNEERTLIETGIEVELSSVGGGSACAYQFTNTDKRGLLEFDISGLSDQYESGRMQASLTLTVKSGSLDAGKCLDLSSIADDFEDGVIALDD